MFMGCFHGAATLGARRAAGLPTSLPRPDEFEAVFITIGRQACEEEFSVGRATVTRWLNELGKDRLIGERADYVRSQVRARLRPCPVDFAAAFPYLGLKGCRRRYRTSWHQVYRWLDECGREKLLEARRRYTGDRDPVKQINMVDVGRVLGLAYPVERFRAGTGAPNLKRAPDNGTD